MENPIVEEILNQEKQHLAAFLNISLLECNDILQQSIIVAEMAGHYNKIFIIDFLNKENILIGSVCIKYSDLEIMNHGLQMETEILNVLQTNTVVCPAIICSGNVPSSHNPYIIMNVASGHPVGKEPIDLNTARSILDVIIRHETVLLDHLVTIPSLSKFNTMETTINFQEKIHSLLATIVPAGNIVESLEFLNEYLNDPYIITNRILATDRSSENIFRNTNGLITLIDFSTIRIGSLFDNWIQYIDDPRAQFSCTYSELIELFFDMRNIDTSYINCFYAASIYTNLLQGIFNYERNRSLALLYFEKVNQAYSNLNNKKSMLIEINP